MSDFNDDGAASAPTDVDALIADVLPTTPPAWDLDPEAHAARIQEAARAEADRIHAEAAADALRIRGEAREAAHRLDTEARADAERMAADAATHAERQREEADRVLREAEARARQVLEQPSTPPARPATTGPPPPVGCGRRPRRNGTASCTRLAHWPSRR